MIYYNHIKNKNKKLMAKVQMKEREYNILLHNIFIFISPLQPLNYFLDDEDQSFCISC